MNNNFQHQQKWNYNSHQNYRPDFRNKSNYHENQPYTGFENNRFNHDNNGTYDYNSTKNLHHHSNQRLNQGDYNHDNYRQHNYNRQPDCNYRNGSYYDNSNSRNNHGSYYSTNFKNVNHGNQYNGQNQFHNPFFYKQNHFESRSDHKSQSSSNKYSNRDQILNSDQTNLSDKPHISKSVSNKDKDKLENNYTNQPENIETEICIDSKYGIKKTNAETKMNLNIKKEMDNVTVSPRKTLESGTTKSAEQKTSTIKTEKTLVRVKSEPIEPSNDSNMKGDHPEETKSSRAVRASRRTTKTVKPTIVESEEDDEVNVKSVRKTRKRKVESSDDEYVPEAPSTATSILKTKTTRTRKTVRGVKTKEEVVSDELKIKEEDTRTNETIQSKEKPVRKTRVTKKMKIEQEYQDVNFECDIAANAKVTTTKSAPKRNVKKIASMKTTESDQLPNTDVNACEEERTAKKVATKRKFKMSADDIDIEGSENVTKKTKKIIKPNESYWTDENLLAEMCQCDVYVAWNFIKLINSDNTIPFIARYRKEMVQNFEAEKLREMKQAYENILEIHQKANTIINKIDALKKLTPDLKKSINCCKSLEELDLVYSPFKVGSKGTKAEKAKKLGLEAPALALLNGHSHGDLRELINTSNPDLNNVEKVKDGIQHILADVIAKDTGVLETLQELVKNSRIVFESTKTKQAETIDNFDKYETYFSYSCDIKFVKPHAVLAINRGESHKVLSVNVKLNDWLQNKLFDFCKRKWLSGGISSGTRTQMFGLSFEDSFKRLIKPFIVRSIRTQLNQAAEIASIQVFASNLKQLLLVPPMHGAVIMAIDPGYSHGCKVAIIDTQGNVLVTDTLYIKFNKHACSGRNSNDRDINALKLRDMVLRHRCELIAIGNGTACRETESYMSDLIQRQWFEPLNVCYTIISEQGASIYSCSAEAKKEFPTLDPNVVSAISLARRLQDPLSELVKIEPKHLGVGMYQHDVPEKQLTSTLNEVVSECVSFVGVDINCASQAMLRRLAGLTDATASNIVKHRTDNGRFTCREDLKKVKGIGEKRFEQCAGFVRISLTEGNKGKHNPLDSTWIHPESYEIARKFARNARVDLSDLGKDSFVSAVKSYIGYRTVESWAEEYGTSATSMALIIEAFKLPRDFDLRSKLSKPLFKKGIQTLDDIAGGTVLTGKVNNVTHFGCFVDIGLERDGLIHISKLKTVVLKLNDKVNVRVVDVDKARKRVGLEFIELLP